MTERVTSTAKASSRPPLLEVDGLKMHYRLTGGVFGRTRGFVQAVDGISFELAQGFSIPLEGSGDVL